MPEYTPFDELAEVPELSPEDVDILADRALEDQVEYRANYWSGNYD